DRGSGPPRAADAVTKRGLPCPTCMRHKRPPGAPWPGLGPLAPGRCSCIRRGVDTTGVRRTTPVGRKALGGANGRECRVFPRRPRVSIYPAVAGGGAPASLGGAVRSFVLLALVSASALAAPSIPTESAGTLGRADLASSNRIHTLVQLDARRVVALDAAGLARLWDIADWQQTGVASPGTRAVIGPEGLSLPADRAAGCVLAAPLPVTPDGRLLTADGRAPPLCDPRRPRPPPDLSP